jgi:hypothetical protein
MRTLQRSFFWISMPGTLSRKMFFKPRTNKKRKILWCPSLYKMDFLSIIPVKDIARNSKAYSSSCRHLLWLVAGRDQRVHSTPRGPQFSAELSQLSRPDHGQPSNGNCGCSQNLPHGKQPYWFTPDTPERLVGGLWRGETDVSELRPHGPIVHPRVIATWTMYDGIDRC